MESIHLPTLAGIEAGDAVNIGALFADALTGVPIASLITEVVRISGSVRGSIDQARISEFLRNLSHTTPEQRFEFMAKYSEGDRRTHALNLLIKVTETDDVRKAAVIARIFEAMILSDLPEDLADRMIEIVRRSFWADLIDLKNYQEERTFPVSDNPGEALVAVGLVYVKALDLGGMGEDAFDATTTYEITKLGRSLLEFGKPNLKT